MIVAVLASGPSMNVEVAQSVMGKCKVIAVSDAWRLAPWADVLVSSDAAWWNAHPEALKFPRVKYCTAPDFQKIEGVTRFEGAQSGSNSGLLACQIAVSLGATKVLLLGFDMKGAHFFGVHPAPLKNTTAQRFEQFKAQFERFKPAGVQIINCTKNSSLRCYPMAKLEDVLC